MLKTERENKENELQKGKGVEVGAYRIFVGLYAYSITLSAS